MSPCPAAADHVGVARIRTNRIVIGGLVNVGLLVLLALPAAAHHPFGGEAPKTLFEGLISGIGHPVIGFDHLALVIAAGLLAAVWLLWQVCFMVMPMVKPLSGQKQRLWWLTWLDLRQFSV